MIQPPSPNDPTERYFNRELSWIDFNARVLAEAMDEANALLERLKFIGIVCSNLDEFFMVRIASLEETDPVYRQIYEKAFQLMERQNEYFSKAMIPQLEQNQIVRILPHQLNERQHRFLDNIFHKDILPLLTPIGLREDPQLQMLVNLSLYICVALKKPDDSLSRHYAVIEIPKNSPRMIFLPSDGKHEFVLIEDVITLFARELFQGYEILEHGFIRITRAAEMTLDEEKDQDFSLVMSEALRMRRRGEIVRIEMTVPEEMGAFLKAKLNVEEFKIVYTECWMDLKKISQLAFQPGFDDLKRPAWVPRHNLELEETDDIWAVLKEKDVMMHRPYESFDAFIRFLSKAADDPDVLAIKQTLYRVANPSAIVDCLARAAEQGKRVTVLIELKARFEEEKNIEWAHRLVLAGASVLYGVAGLKTHAKACLVIRREPEGIKRYVHFGTGNYNEKTAKLYSDLDFFSSREDLTMDVASFFNVVTGFSQPARFSKIEISPYGLRRKLKKLILRESMRSRREEPGLLLAKMNSLVDPELIEALYHASQAGVKIKLNVRGICCLRPGVPGLSENIEVLSIVDMFLEHNRIFYFGNAGNEEVYLSSADWMPRNLDRRLEILFPIEDGSLRDELKELLEQYFQDNTKSWNLCSDGTYRKRSAEGGKPFRVQDVLCKEVLEKEKGLKKVRSWDLKPQRPVLDSKE